MKWNRRANGSEPEPAQPQGRTLTEFDAGWHDVITKYVPKNQAARPRLPVNVMPDAAKWVTEEVLPLSRGNVPGNVYGMALVMGAFCMYAGLQGRKPYLKTPDHRAANLPLMSEYVDDPANPLVTIATSPPVWSAHTWAHFEAGIGDEHLVHAGLHVLGALTLMPEHSGLSVRDGASIATIIPPFAIAGAQPFPADIQNSFFAPQ